MIPIRRVAATTAVLVALLVLPVSSQGAVAPRANLVPAAPTGVSGQRAPGEKVTATVTVANRGRAASTATRLRVYLSSDRAWSPSDQVLVNARVAGIRAARVTTVRGAFTFPANAASGRWYVLACVDYAKLVRESNERDNCRAAAAATNVARPSLTLLAPTAGSIHAGDPTLDVTTTEATTLDCTIDGANVTCSDGAVLPVAGDGTHTLVVRAAGRKGLVAVTQLSTFVVDRAAPSGVAVTYADGLTGATAASITVSGGTDTTGIAWVQLLRASATMDGAGTCGTFGAFAQVGATNPTSPHTDTSLVAGTCYRYQVVATDAVGRSSTATGSGTIRVETDIDGDGFGNVSGDCDDANPNVNPGEADTPDELFADDDCDGIDGDASKAVFVSNGGSDAAAGTQAAPKQNLAAAITAAAASNRDVYVQSGVYGSGPTGVALATNVDIYGGYNASWVRGTYGTTIHAAREGLFGDGVTGVHLDQLYITGTGSPTSGQSTYGLRLVNGASVTGRALTINAGNGVGGASGATGANGLPGAAGSLVTPPGTCTTQTFGGIGPAAVSALPPGGNGGNGGAPGMSGSPGDAAGPNPGGLGGTFGNGANGAPGSNGAHGGVPGSTPFTVALATESWTGANGNDGSDGADGLSGAGGGGGAGTGGRYGGPGGAGSNGGGGGKHGGAGLAGGGSFAIYLEASTVALDASTATAANGGTGGAGGHGGWGTLLVPGRLGGDCTGVGSTKGGNGGNGGSGGVGTGGTGGAGGPSIAVFGTNGSTFTPTAVSLVNGSAGVGGNGGASGLQNGMQQVADSPAGAAGFSAQTSVS